MKADFSCNNQKNAEPSCCPKKFAPKAMGLFSIWCKYVAINITIIKYKICFIISRVLFHAGSEATGRRQLLLGRHQRVCVVLHASPNGATGSSRLSSPTGSGSMDSSGAGIGNVPLTAACSPDGEDGVCLAQITIPANWWPPLPPPDASGRIKVPKTLPRTVQLSYSVLEPRSPEDAPLPHVLDSGSSSFCQPRVQIQPVTNLGSVTLAPNREDYKELKTDEYLTLLIPHGPLYPRSRLHVPAFLHSHSSRQGAQGRPPVAAVVLRYVGENPCL